MTFEDDYPTMNFIKWEKDNETVCFNREAIRCYFLDRKKVIEKISTSTILTPIQKRILMEELI